MSAVVINTYFPGIIGGCVKHQDKQSLSIPVTGGFMTKSILHTDRKTQPCVRVTNINEEVLNYWTSNEVPPWENARKWSGYNRERRVASYVTQFDEGYGVNFKIT